MKLWAVDPGGEHVGMAEFSNFAGVAGTGQCDRAWETTPETAVDAIAAAMLNYEIDVLVVEEFRLYPDKAMAQTGSTMPTCEMIGCIKWAHRLDCRRRRDLFCAADDELDRRDDQGQSKRTKEHQKWMAQRARNQNEVLLVLQPASIQKPTEGVLRKRGMKSVAKASAKQIREAGGVGDHALSAELHGWHYLLRQTGEAQ
ncbi:MAG TPA: hypothetical protein VFT75_18395 [Nocardioidaceae bacterium]|nr:hypothetical protein [Nocardioidaceae bacterium]